MILEYNYCYELLNTFYLLKHLDNFNVVETVIFKLMEYYPSILLHCFMSVVVVLHLDELNHVVVGTKQENVMMRSAFGKLKNNDTWS